jgi:hypothetical protein
MGDSCTTKDAAPSPRIEGVLRRMIVFTMLVVSGLVLVVAILSKERMSGTLLLETSKEIPKGCRAVVHVIERRHVGDERYDDERER